MSYELIPVDELFDDTIEIPSIVSEAAPNVPNQINNKYLLKILDDLKPIDWNKLSNKSKRQNIQNNEFPKKLDDICNIKVQNIALLVECVENVIHTSINSNHELCHYRDNNYIYNGKYWCIISNSELELFFGLAAEKMGIDKYIAKYYKFREELKKQFTSVGLKYKPEVLKDKVKINLENGTFNITPQGIYLSQYDKNDLFTYQLPFKFDTEAKAPLFENFINRVLPDEECQNVLSEYLGYLFIKNGSKILKEEKALILYGQGANGKSIINEIVYALLGKENVSSYSLESLTDEKGFCRVQIADKLVNYATEISNKLEISYFKQLVSGEPVQASYKYKNPEIIEQYAKLIFNCNELPKVEEHSNAFFRRFLIIPFNVTIPEAEQDKQLHTKIIESELSGIFNWILDGLNRLLKNKKFTNCQAADDAVKQYKSESDSVFQFITENRFVPNINSQYSYGELYKNYRIFCSNDGCYPLEKLKFKNRLLNQGFQIERKNVGYVVYLGISETDNHSDSQSCEKSEKSEVNFETFLKG